jgi:hypothetical protein
VSAVPTPPKDFRTRLLEALSDKNIRYYAGPGFSEFIDKLAGLVPLLPGSGTVQSMQDSAQAGKDLEAGNYANAAAHFLPNAKENYMSPPRVFGLRQTGSVATAIISPAKNALTQKNIRISSALVMASSSSN